MNYHQFVGQVQHRARLADTGEAIRAVRATLQTLSERLAGGEAKDLASQLPHEIGYYLMWNEGLPPERFGLEEFFRRAAEREGAHSIQIAEAHARAVTSVLKDAVSAGEIKDVRSQLPKEFAPLFPDGIAETELVRSSFGPDEF